MVLLAASLSTLLSMLSSMSCTNLAQLAFGAGLRDDLLVGCCECLADNSTTNATATCTEAVLVDGQVVVPDDAVFGGGDDNVSIPCLCDAIDADGCIADLRNKTPILIPGACVDELDGEAPCQSACAGVISFSPVPAG